MTRVAARAAAVVATILTSVIIAAAGCGLRDDAPHVILYTSADPHIAREVVTLFERETGIRVDVVGDTEAKKTTGLVERLRAERDHPRADVFWSSENLQTIELAAAGVLAPHAGAVADAWPSAHKDPEGRWFAFAARARVIVYDPDRLPPDARPATWTDLTQRRYAGRIAMADPRFGTTGGHLAAMKVYWDRHAMPGYYEAFLLGLRDNDVRLLPSGNAGVVEAVVTGEADVGLTDTDDVWAAQANGHRVAMAYPDHNREDEPGNGTLVIPNTVGRVVGGPQPELAGRLIDFLLSETVERHLARSVSRNIPLGPGRATAFPDLAVPDPLAIDVRRAAAARTQAVAMAMRIFTRPEIDDAG